MNTVPEKTVEAVSIPFRYEVASWILMGIATIAIVAMHLVPALLAGLLVFYLVNTLAGAVRIPYINNRYVKLFFVAVLGMIVVAALTALGIGVGVFLRGGPENLPALLRQMARIVHDLRRVLPDSVLEYLPPDVDGIQDVIALWFREHAHDIRTFGTDTVRLIVQVVIGLIIGAMIALHKVAPHAQPSPFVRALTQRARLLARSFRYIMISQVPISAVNTALTAIYLAVLLPYYGNELPFTKTLIAVTFLAGLLPVVGNLISNTAILLVSLGQSFGLALVSLGYLVVIHKLEYFLNARIVGRRINAKSWELLIAMLLLESAFGVNGLIAAPLLYAYVKLELREQGLV